MHHLIINYKIKNIKEYDNEDNTSLCLVQRRGAGRGRRRAARARPWRKVNGTRLSRSHTGIPYLNLVRRKMAVGFIPPPLVYEELIKHIYLAN